MIDDTMIAMKSTYLLIVVSVLLVLSTGCSNRHAEIEESFAAASTAQQEAAAIRRVIEDNKRSSGRYSYACFPVCAKGERLSFEKALKEAERGESVRVAIRLQDQPSFGPEPIELGTFWHNVIETENLRRLLSAAFTFSEIGEPPPAP